MPAHHRWSLRAVGPYELATSVRGHGWYDLPPHHWDEGCARLDTALAVDEGRAVDVRVEAGADRALRARITAAARLGRPEAGRVRQGLRRMLRLDVDLGAFWAECARHARLAWVPGVCAGHLMQSATLFEDLMKILFTTNCTWAATRGMTRNLIDALGPAAPSGRRAFPTAGACAEQDEGFWRDVVRAGYRARSCASLARGFATGALRAEEFEDPGAAVDDLRGRLLALPGFGPYAVGHALRGLGHYEDLALDSWCRPKMAQILGRRKPPSDSWFEREYRRFGRFAGLALWMELTADWHGAGG